MIKELIRYTVIIQIVFLFACSGNRQTAETEADAINPAFLKEVKTIKAVLSNLHEELTLTGKVEYDPDKVINYTSLVSGIADRTYFSLGDKVQKGQTLVDIRSSDLSSLQSELIASESEVRIAQRELQSAQSLFDDNMLSEKELLEAQSRLGQAQAAFEKIKNDIDVHGESKGNGTFSVKSPMSGYVVNKNVSSGSTVSTDGEPLFTVADLSHVWITANVYASNLLFVREGMEVEISTLSYPGEVFKGKINSLSQVFDPEEKVLKARIVMANKDLKFKPEMSAVIKLKNENQSQYIAVPSDALIFDDDRYFIVVEESAGNFGVREVILRSHADNTTYIASGLSEGDNIVTKNQLLIYSALNEK